MPGRRPSTAAAESLRSVLAGGGGGGIASRSRRRGSILESRVDQYLSRNLKGGGALVPSGCAEVVESCWGGSRSLGSIMESRARQYLRFESRGHAVAIPSVGAAVVLDG